MLKQEKVLPIQPREIKIVSTVVVPGLTNMDRLPMVALPPLEFIRKLDLPRIDLKDYSLGN